MADSELFLGLDLGTSGVKLIAFDEKGTEVARAARSYSVSHPGRSTAELDPDLVWRAAVECFLDVDAAARTERATALAISAQGEAIIPVGHDGTVLAASPVSADMRGAPDIARLSREIGAERIHRITGQPVSPLPSLAKIMWWRREQPELVKRVWKYLCYGDFALLKLGIPPVIDESMAARMLAYDITKSEWSSEILEAAGLSVENLPQVVTSGSIIGTVPEHAAKGLRLPGGLVVVAGGHDQPMGAVGAGVLDPEQAMYAIGTTEALVAVLRAPNPSLPARNIACYPHVAPGRYVALAGNQTGASALGWLSDVIDANKADGVDPVLSRIEAAAETFSDGPIFLAHLAGSGSVVNDPQSTGGFFGLGLETSRDQLIGAVLEGVTFEQAIALSALEDAGVPVPDLRAVGGGTKSTAWLAMKADILGRPIARVSVADAPCLGAAVLCAVARGRHASLEAAVTEMVQTGERFAPRTERHLRYAERFDTYRRLYAALSSLRDSASGGTLSWARQV